MRQNGHKDCFTTVDQVEKRKHQRDKTTKDGKYQTELNINCPKKKHHGLKYKLKMEQ